MKHAGTTFDAVTITLNPAIDLTAAIGNFTAGHVNRVAQWHMQPGGKGVNVASVLASNGHKVAVTGFLGTENSKIFEALFAKKQIEDCFVRIPGATRTGIKITDPTQLETTDINFPGLTASLSDLDALQTRLAALEAKWFVIGGSIPPGVSDTIYGDIIRAFKARGGRVALDTSGDALREGIESAPDIIKPNIHELETLVGASLPTQADIINAARAIVAKGVGLVVVSLGAKGACFVSKDEAFIQSPEQIEVKSTVGAGDAMVAGIVSAQLRGLPLADCARIATAFSAAALRRNAAL